MSEADTATLVDRYSFRGNIALAELASKELQQAHKRIRTKYKLEGEYFGESTYFHGDDAEPPPEPREEGETA